MATTTTTADTTMDTKSKNPITPPYGVSLAELAPKSGSNHICRIQISKPTPTTSKDTSTTPTPTATNIPDTLPTVYMKSIDFSKDEEQGAGTGTLKLLYDEEVFRTLQEWAIIIEPTDEAKAEGSSTADTGTTASTTAATPTTGTTGTTGTQTPGTSTTTGDTSTTGSTTAATPSKKDEISKELVSYGEYLLSTGWKHYDGTEDVKETCTGYFVEISYNDDEISIKIKDKGYLLEREGTFQTTTAKRSEIIKKIIEMAGLQASIDFGDVPDDTITYPEATATTTGSTGGCICTSMGGSGVKPCTPGTHCWVNKCPACGKADLALNRSLQGNSGGARDYSSANPDQITCQDHNCDCDFDGCSGWDKQFSPHLQLTPCSGGGAATSTTGTSTTTGTPTDQSNAVPSTQASTGQTASQKSYWDMLLELCNPIKADLQVFVWIDTCYVTSVPHKDTAQLTADTRQNIYSTTVNYTEGRPVEGVTVQYGTGNHLSKVESTSDTVNTGETKTITADNLSQGDAQATADTELAKSLRDNGLNIDLTVQGHSEWYICRWAHLVMPKYDVDESYYITKFNHKFAADKPWETDVTLAIYRPTITVASSTTQQQATGSSAYGNSPAEIRAWMDANIAYESYYGIKYGAQGTLAHRAGNCDDQATLFCYLCAQIGYTQCNVVCCKYCSGIHHCNAEINIGGAIKVADTTCSSLNQV